MGRISLDELRSMLGEHGPDIVDCYRRCLPAASDAAIGAAVTGDWKFRIPSIRFAEAQLAAGQQNVFMYLFAWASSVMPEASAVHALDIPFFFDTTSKAPVTARDPSSQALAKNMSDALVAFAHTGSPQHAGIPQWTAYDREARATMAFDRECRLLSDPMGEERAIWQQFPVAQLGW
jgi:para-nitrobenzyl esterase